MHVCMMRGYKIMTHLNQLVETSLPKFYVDRLKKAKLAVLG